MHEVLIVTYECFKPKFKFNLRFTYINEVLIPGQAQRVADHVPAQLRHPPHRAPRFDVPAVLRLHMQHLRVAR